MILENRTFWNRFARKAILLCTGFLATFMLCSAATIKGKMLDENKEPLVGAHVVIKDSGQFGVVGLDGSFVITGVAAGTHRLLATFIGYTTYEEEITITSEQATLKIDFNLVPDSKLLEEVIIGGTTEAGSDFQAVRSEKNSNQIVNVVSAKTMELSPDITVANVLQRVSGVSLVRNANGDAQYAIVRGMDKRYNYTLVNGIKIPSPDNQNRYIPLDIFPSQALERLEVSKSLTPSMEGDAIGGVVNLIMKNAPEKLEIKSDFQLGYNQINMQRDFTKFDRSVVRFQSPLEKYGAAYQAQPSDFTKKNLVPQNVKPSPDILSSLSVGQRFFGGKLGVMIAGSYQNTYRGTNSIWFNTQTDFFGTNLPQFNNLQERTYSTQQVREALHAKIDFSPSRSNHISFYSGYYHLENNQVREIRETELDARDYKPDQGDAINYFSTRTRLTDQSIFNTTLQGDHAILPFLKVNWSGVYSLAKSQQPDNATFSRSGGLAGGEMIVPNVKSVSRRWDHNSDRDYTGYLNLIFTPRLFGSPAEFSLGGMYRNKERQNFYNQYSFTPTNPSNQVEGENWNTFADVNLSVDNPQGSTFNALNYNAHENLLDGYIQGKFLPINKAEIITGVRIENTDQGYSLISPGPADVPKFSQKYTDVLPSLSIKYMPNDRMNIRSAYYKAISRPGYFEIVPYYIVNEDYDETGNPALKRIQAHNFDLRWEFFPSSFDKILAGVFYKKIIDPIEYALVPIGAQGDALQPGNYGTARNLGFELDFTKYFSKFGVRANYTYTSSKITTSKSYRTRENPNDPSSQLITKDTVQTRSLQGQAKHIANLSLLFKDVRRGTDAQLSFVYTGSFIETVSPYIDNDMWTKPVIQVSFSAEQKVSEHFTAFIKVQNLLNSPYEVIIRKPNYNQGVEYPYQNSSKNTLVRRDQYYQSFRLGVRYNF